MLIVADRDIHAQEVLGRLRVELAGRLGLADPNVLAYVWVHQFPMYQWDADARRWDATHNPFSGVMPEDVAAARDRSRATRTSPTRLTRPDAPGRSSTTWPSTAGSWVAARSGSTPASCWRARSRSRATPPRGWSSKFGGILEAFEYGAPPHGGIALGVDRWAALLTDQTNIREVMAFPKTSSGSDLMLDAPSAVEPGQLAELGLALAPRAASAEPGRRAAEERGQAPAQRYGPWAVFDGVMTTDGPALCQLRSRTDRPSRVGRRRRQHLQRRQPAST